MRNYCTLFDVNYMAKGLALYNSLQRTSTEPFEFWVLAMDTEVFWLLDAVKSDYPNMGVVYLPVIESSLNLSAVRESRNWMEYCWTCASQFMEYLFSRGAVSEGEFLTYLDSDLFFFSDPQAIFNEIGDRAIAIVPHRFRPGLERLEPNGIFNVGWLSIRNSPVGLKCLTTWAAQCREWCYHRNEDGKFGDQAYLDSWPSTYADKLCIIQNIGVGLAPWNVQQYKILRSEHLGEVLIGRDCCSTVPLVFYHFHEFQHIGKDVTRYTRHPIDQIHRDVIYYPYAVEIGRAHDVITKAKETRATGLKSLQDQAEAF